MNKAVVLDLGLVVAAHGRHYLVETPEGRRLRCHPRGKKSDCVVGDRVRWQPAGDEGVIEHLEPRRNLLYRQDEWKTKSFAANLDLLLVLVAGEPMFSESQLSRALVAAESQGIPACILLNKVDLPAAALARDRLQPYAAMGTELLALSLKSDPAGAREALWPKLKVFSIATSLPSPVSFQPGRVPSRVTISVGDSARRGGLAITRPRPCAPAARRRVGASSRTSRTAGRA